VKAGNDLRMHLSISQLSDLTGRDRRTIAKNLDGIHYTPGERGAFLYESTEALPLVYAVDNLEAARARQAMSQASLNAVREEEMRKQRIPLSIVRDTVDEVFQAIGSTLKAAKNKKLTTERINELFDKWRDLPAKLQWQNENKK
jgi:hypothetical protein